MECVVWGRSRFGVPPVQRAGWPFALALGWRWTGAGARKRVALEASERMNVQARQVSM